MSRLLWILLIAAFCVVAAVGTWAAQTGAAKEPAAGQTAAPSSKGAGGTAAKAGAPMTLVAVQEAVQALVAGEHTFVGTIVPKRISSVGSAVDGRVTDFPANEGDPVEKGATLAQLLTGQLDIQLEGAKAELELRKQALEELRASWPEEVKQAEARHLQRKAALEYAASREKRAKALHKTGTVSDELLQEAESLSDQANQAYVEARSALNVTQGPRRLAIVQAEQNVAVQEQAVNAIQDQINKHTIRAPFDGYVVQEFTEIGEWVAKAGLIAEIAELDEVDVEIMVVENYLSSLSIGAKARIEVPALSHGGDGSEFTGQVALIVPQADQRSRTFPVKVRLKNSKRSDGQLLLKAGMLARVTLPVSTPSEAVLVPKDAIVLGGESPMVFVVDQLVAGDTPGGPQRGVVRGVPVTLGIEQNNLIQVKGELKPRELVAVQGNERLRPGLPVAVSTETTTRQ